MGLRTKEKNFENGLKEFNTIVQGNFSHYTDISQFLSFASVEKIFDKYLSYSLQGMPPLYLFDEVLHDNPPKDFVSYEQAHRNCLIALENKFVLNHLKLTCLENTRKLYLDWFFVKPLFNDICHIVYSKKQDHLLRSDLREYFSYLYPEMSQEEFKDITTESVWDL